MIQYFTDYVAGIGTTSIFHETTNNYIGYSIHALGKTKIGLSKL